MWLESCRSTAFAIDTTSELLPRRDEQSEEDSCGTFSQFPALCVGTTTDNVGDYFINIPRKSPPHTHTHTPQGKSTTTKSGDSVRKILVNDLYIFPSPRSLAILAIDTAQGYYSIVPLHSYTTTARGYGSFRVFTQHRWIFCSRAAPDRWEIFSDNVNRLFDGRVCKGLR